MRNASTYLITHMPAATRLYLQLVNEAGNTEPTIYHKNTSTQEGVGCPIRGGDILGFTVGFNKTAMAIH